MRASPTRLVIRLFPAVAALAVVALAQGCFLDQTSPPAADVCEGARNQFAACGTSLPLLTDGPCSGTTRIVARCVVDHAHDCDELASLLGRIDACVADLLDGGDPLLPPATDLPAPSPSSDGGRDASNDDAGRNADAAPLPTDGGSTTDTGALTDSGTETRP